MSPTIGNRRMRKRCYVTGRADRRARLWRGSPGVAAEASGTVTCSLDRLARARATPSWGVNLGPDVVDGTWIANTAYGDSADDRPGIRSDTIRAGKPGSRVQCFLPERTCRILKTMAPTRHGRRSAARHADRNQRRAERRRGRDRPDCGLCRADRTTRPCPPRLACDGGVTCAAPPPCPRRRRGTLAY